MTTYCTQNAGDCSTCSLVNYGSDCCGNSVAKVTDGRCQCGRPVIYCETHRANWEASDAARLDACRAADPAYGVKTDETKAFFGETIKYDALKLADMGYGDITRNGTTVELTEAEVAQLAASVGGTVEEIETARS